jgi:hypothetical protein
VDLAIESTYVETIFVARVDCDDSYVTAIRADDGPIAELCRIAEGVSVSEGFDRGRHYAEDQQQKGTSETKSL